MADIDCLAWLPEAGGRTPDGFEGKLTSSKWAAAAKCSPDTALRDINDLLASGVLRKTAGGGRSTGYELSGQGDGGRSDGR